MKTISLNANSNSRPLTRRASLAATILAGSALLVVYPIFAQTNPADSGDASPPSFDQPWDDGSGLGDGGPSLAPAPEQPYDPDYGSIYVPPPPVGLLERPGYTPINPTSPELLPPSESVARPADGFIGPVR
jgi:hypothetical protein